MKHQRMTLTMAGQPKPEPKRVNALKYYIRVIRWLVKHRAEKNNRQKWRRMERELKP